MYWNHRVIKHTLPDGEQLFTVREVFYDEHDSEPPATEPYAFVTDPDGVQAESLDGLREYIGWMLKSLDLPVLTPADFGVSEEDALKKEQPAPQP